MLRPLAFTAAVLLLSTGAAASDASPSPRGVTSWFQDRHVALTESLNRDLAEQTPTAAVSASSRVLLQQTIRVTAVRVLRHVRTAGNGNNI